MIQLGLVLAISMIGQADGTPAKARPIEPPRVADPGDLDQALAEYNALREKAGKSAAAQWRLALWCEKNGLKAEALAHLAEVARLDPKRDAVWKKLGFKKVGGRWTTDALLAEEKEQRAADKLWGPKLKKLHKDLHGTNGSERQRQAQSEFDAIKDPHAVLPLYREFGGSRLDQSILIQALDQISSPMATRMLAYLAVYGRSPEICKQATLALRQRPAGDYLELLLGFLVDPVKYEVRHVGGPGSPGAIFVEGERFNVARFYAPPAAPVITPLPGDIMTFGADGQPAILRPIGGGLSGETHGVKGSKTLVQSTTTETTLFAAISPSQLQQEARRTAMSAEAQLRSDEKEIRAINSERGRFNDRILAVARDASGKDFGTTPKDWRDGLAGFNKQSPRSQPAEKPTLPELAPLMDSPRFGPSGFFVQAITSTRVFEDS